MKDPELRMPRNMAAFSQLEGHLIYVTAALSNDRRRGSRGGSSRRRNSSGSSTLTVDLDSSLRALARDMSSLATAVAGLTSGGERTAVGRSAVARDVAELSTGVALLSLSLAVAGEVVRPAALVAGRGAIVGQAATGKVAVAASAGGGAAASARDRTSTGTGTRGRAGALGCVSDGGSRGCGY